MSLKDAILRVVDYLKGRVEYADLRFEEIEYETIEVENGMLKSYEINSESGIGIRVLEDGSWGFASTNDLSLDGIFSAVKKSIEIARIGGLLSKDKVELAENEIHEDEYFSPCEVNPFEIPKEKKMELLILSTEEMMKVKGISRAEGRMEFRKIDKLFASTEGSTIHQRIVQSGGGLFAYAMGEDDFQVRSYPSSFGGDHANRGWEFIEEMKFLENARRVAEEAREILLAPEIPVGEFDIIVDGSQMALQIHESCGHPVELDRVMGSEISFAGSSFLTLDKLGKFRYGSEIVNIVADATNPMALGSFGYDDEGVKASRTYIIRDGIFVGYLMSRETARKLGMRSNGTMRAQSWNYIPLIRMTSIDLLPGKHELEDLIGEIKHGFYLETNKSWSIDDFRLNFQFATERAVEIRNGKLGKVYKNAVYYGRTPEFWAKCDGIANEKYWHVWGIPNCGKGEPVQTMGVSHGSSPARFRKVKVGVKR